MASKVWPRIVPAWIQTQELLIDLSLIEGDQPLGYANTMTTWVTFDFKDMITCCLCDTMITWLILDFETLNTWVIHEPNSIITLLTHKPDIVIIWLTQDFNAMIWSRFINWLTHTQDMCKTLTLLIPYFIVQDLLALAWFACFF